MNAKVCISLSIIFWQRFLCSAQNTNSALDADWKQFKKKFNKSYKNQTHEGHRRRIWETNFKFIHDHNIKYNLGLKSYSMGVNNFSDMTHKEFKSVYMPFNYTVAIRNISVPLVLLASSLPENVDWRMFGFITPVKNQYKCGSCWAFSAVAAIESYYYKIFKKTVILSEQQLVDCSKSNYGCDGGLMFRAFEDIRDTGGIQLQSDYPYFGQTNVCAFNKAKVITSVKGYQLIPQNEVSLAEAVAKVGPISVGIDASQPSFQYYKSGVYNEPLCSSSKLDHALLLVGYGVTSDNQKYWIMKNSWNANWGQQGYIWMSKDKNNQCGVATDASYPILTSGSNIERKGDCKGFPFTFTLISVAFCLGVHKHIY